ncbi:MAG: hypothetical protein OXB84_06275 [Halobacteriovoraceae bacterium]|nr:hypothetical protein [Halobacteriovoraceae bacterium]
MKSLKLFVLSMLIISGGVMARPIKMVDLRHLSESDYEQLIDEIKNLGLINDPICFGFTNLDVLDGTDENSINRVDCPSDEHIALRNIIYKELFKNNPEGIPSSESEEENITFISIVKIKDPFTMLEIFRNKSDGYDLTSVTIDGYSLDDALSGNAEIKEHLFTRAKAVVKVPLVGELMLKVSQLARIGMLFSMVTAEGEKAIRELHPHIFIASGE